MPRSWAYPLVTTLLGALVAVVPASPAVTLTGVTTFVTATSEIGDSVGLGDHRLWRTGSGRVTVTGRVNDVVTVHASGGATGSAFTFQFAAPPGKILTRGVYEDAERAVFRTPGHPGIDVWGDGRGCNEVAGRFTVLDITPDLGRLWLVYEQHCEGKEPAIFGEIRYRHPVNDAQLVVAPSHIAWPDEYPGVSGRLVPVTLVNKGLKARSVESATVTEGADHFSVAQNTCTTLAKGAICTIYTRFKPAGAGDHAGTLTIRLSSTPLGRREYTVALRGSGIPGITSWEMRREPGDYHVLYTPANATLTVAGSPSVIHARVESGTSYWYADFEADSGNQLLPGTTFSGAEEYPSNAGSTPGLNVWGSGGSCGSLTGSFTVEHAVYDEAQRLQQLRLSFEQRCTGSTSTLMGTIAWRAPPGP